MCQGPGVCQGCVTVSGPRGVSGPRVVSGAEPQRSSVNERTEAVSDRIFFCHFLSVTIKWLTENRCRWDYNRNEMLAMLRRILDESLVTFEE